MSARTVAIGVLLCALSGPAMADETVVVGMPAWPSAQVTAHIIADTLEERVGVEVELRNRGTVNILMDIADGDIQVHPEVWLPNLSALVRRLSKNDVLRLSPRGVAAQQNICATRETLDETGITAVSDLAKPEMAARFDSDGDGKGEIWIGAETWSSTSIEKIRAKSYGYDRTMTLLEMPEDVAMAAVDAAVAVGKPVVFYCYGPHHIFKLHDIVQLQEPEYDPSRWAVVKPADDPDWLEKSQAPTAWDLSHFHVAWAAALDNKMPQVARFLSEIAFEPADISAMSYAVEVERKPVEEVAKEWISDNGERIGEWVK